MKKDLSISPRTRLVIISTFLFGLAAHAFRYFSLGFSHDSMLVFQNEAQWQISLGRFLQPVYLLIRGRLCAPFLIGVFSLIWLTAAIILVVKMLNVESKTVIILICGILSTNSTLSLSNATYLPWSDVFMLAFLFSAAGVYLQRNYKFGFLFGAVFITCSLALYQSYFEVAVAVSLILLVKDCFDNLDAKSICLRGFKALCSLLIGLVLYYIILKSILYLTGIELATTYNGISGVTDYSGVPVLQLLVKTYFYLGKYIVFPVTFHPVLAAIINFAVLLLLGAGVIKVCVQRALTKSRIVLMVVLISLMPLGWNIVYFISHGFKHDLMAYSFFFFYVFALMVLEYHSKDILIAKRKMVWSGKNAFRNLLPIVTIVGIGILIINNIVYANQLYLKKELEYQATLSTMTRVLTRIEQTDGYVVNETPVIIIGSLNNSELSVARPGFEDITGVAMSRNYSLTYLETYAHFFDDILGYPVNLVLDEEVVDRYSALQQVQSMPAFPSAGFCAMINDRLVVKLS